MSITLISEPDKTLGTIDSNVIAVKTQALYEFKRKDHACTFSDNAGDLKITIATDVTSSYSRYDSLYVGDDSSVYSKVSTIKTVPAFGGGNTTFDMELDFVSSPAGGYVNNLTTRSNYRVDIQVFDTAGTTQIIDETFEYVPKQEGTVKPDLKDIFLFLLEKDDITFLDVIPKYREAWTGNEAGAYAALANMLIVRVERQIQDPEGANLLRYLLQKELSYTIQDWIESNGQQTLRISDAAGVGNITGFFPEGAKVFIQSNLLPYSSPDRIGTVFNNGFAANLNIIRLVNQWDQDWGGGGSRIVKPFVFGRFLTKFERPRMWRYWDASIYYLMDEDFASRTSATLPQVFESSVNVNDVVQSALDSTNGAVVPGIIEYKIINTQISNEGLEVGIRDSNTGAIILCKKIIFDIDNGQFDSPIMLQWLNELGGYDQWIFQVEQEINPQYSEGVMTQKPVTDDIQTLTARTRIRERVVLNQKLTLTVDKLTQNQAETIQYLSKSDAVYVWIQQDSARRVGITVDTRVYSYSNMDELFEVSFTISMPENFDFFKAKKY